MAESVPLGVTAVFGFEVIDLDGTAVEGLTSSAFDITLRYRTGTDPYSLAPEAVSIADRLNGSYEASFTPGDGSEGYFYWLSVAENSTITNGQYARHNFFAEIGGDSITYTENDAFCTLADVKSLVQRGAFGASTIPTESQVLDFMAWRAAEIEAVLQANGYAKTIPGGGAPIGTASDEAIRIGRLARNLNARGAAADAIFSHEVRDRGDLPERSRALITEYQEGLGRLAALLQSGAAESQVSRSAAYTESTTDVKEFDMTTEW